MYIGFRGFLGALCIVGVALGAVFGVGVGVGRGQRPAVAAVATQAAGAGAAALAAGGGGAGFGGGGAGVDGTGAVAGSIESVSATSMVVKTPAGASVTLTLNAQTAVRKNEAGTLQDLRTGDQVLVARDASSVATSVQLVPPGAAGLRGGPGAGGTAGASATAPAKGTPPPR